MLKLTLLTLTLLAAAPVFGQGDKTVGAYNGRYWTRCPEPVKAGLVVGFAMAMEVRIAVSKQNGDKFGLGGTVGDTVRALDGYYRRDEVLNTPIWVAIRILKLEQDGLSADELDAVMIADGIWRAVTPAK